MNDTTSFDPRGAKKLQAEAEARRPDEAPRLTDLEPEQIQRLSPEEKAEYERQRQETEDDFGLFVDFITELYPLARRHFKAERDAGREQAGNEAMRESHRKLTEAWTVLADHVLSLPSYAENDPGWLARMSRHHERTKARRAARSSAAEAPAAEQSVSTGRGEGKAYVEAFLTCSNPSAPLDMRWVAEIIDSGALVACPRCHFLHLPQAPFPKYMTVGEQQPDPPDACDVCPMVPGAIREYYDHDGLQGLLAASEDELREYRWNRAATLYDLWIGGLNGATAWVSDELLRTTRALTEAAGQPAPPPADESTAEEASGPE